MQAKRKFGSPLWGSEALGFWGDGDAASGGRVLRLARCRLVRSRFCLDCWQLQCQMCCGERLGVHARRWSSGFVLEEGVIYSENRTVLHHSRLTVLCEPSRRVGPDRQWVLWHGSLTVTGNLTGILQDKNSKKQKEDDPSHQEL